MSNFNVNRVVLAGNMTADAELRQTGSGKDVANFSIAVNESRKDAQGEWQEEAHFFNVTVWGYQATLAAEQGGKGVPVVVEGRLRQEKWEDKDTGQKREAVKVNAEKFIPYARPEKRELVAAGVSADDAWLDDAPAKRPITGQTDDIGFD